MTTVHSYTNDQKVQDIVHKDLTTRTRSSSQHYPNQHRRS